MCLQHFIHVTFSLHFYSFVLNLFGCCILTYLSSYVTRGVNPSCRVVHVASSVALLPSAAQQSRRSRRRRRDWGTNTPWPKSGWRRYVGSGQGNQYTLSRWILITDGLHGSMRIKYWWWNQMKVRFAVDTLPRAAPPSQCHVMCHVTCHVSCHMTFPPPRTRPNWRGSWRPWPGRTDSSDRERWPACPWVCDVQSPSLSSWTERSVATPLTEATRASFILLSLSGILITQKSLNVNLIINRNQKILPAPTFFLSECILGSTCNCQCWIALVLSLPFLTTIVPQKWHEINT